MVHPLGAVSRLDGAGVAVVSHLNEVVALHLSGSPPLAIFHKYSTLYKIRQVLFGMSLKYGLSLSYY